MQSSLFVPVILISIVVGCVIAFFVSWGMSSRCPACAKWFSRRVLATNEIDRSTAYETVTRYDITRDREGKEISRTERKEQVRVTHYKYENECECRKCGHDWFDVTSKKVEG